MQTLKIEANIQIPADYCVILKSDYESLLSQNGSIYWTMKDLERVLNKKSDWIKDKILFHPKLKKELNVLNGGPAVYPRSRGEQWIFHAEEMREYLKNNFYKFFEESRG